MNGLDQEIFLTAALEGLTRQRERIEEQIRDLRARLGKHGASSGSTQEAATDKPRRKRNMSTASRARIAAAQRKRWEQYRKDKEGKA